MPDSELLPKQKSPSVLPPRVHTGPLTWRGVFGPPLRAVRRLWLPFVCIQTCGVLVVVLYFTWPAFTGVANQASAWKSRYGLLAAAVSMPLACSVLPELLNTLLTKPRRPVREVLAAMAWGGMIFAVIGIMTDVFYRWINGSLGGSRDVGTVASKVLIDQLLFSPLLSLPWIAGCFTFQRCRYRPGALLSTLGARWYAREVAPLIVTCWAYWFPMCSLMYVLPPALTFLFALLASAASATLMTAVATGHTPSDTHPAAAAITGAHCFCRGDACVALAE